MSRIGRRARRGRTIRLGSVNCPDPDVLVPTVLATVGEAREAWDCRPCPEHVRAIVESIVAAVCPDRVSTTGDSARTGVPLTAREREVLLQLSVGLTACQIAHRLGISSATVRKHLEHAYAKLGVHDRLTATISGPRAESAPGVTARDFRP